MKKIATIVFVLCLVPLVYADVEVTLKVEWTALVHPLYRGTVCIENTNLFGLFDNVIMEYSHNDHSGDVPSPKDLFLQNQWNNIYCADLKPTYWDATPLADTLDNIKITVKYGKDVVFQDGTWSTDVPVSINNPNHLFHDYRTEFNISFNQGWNLISIPVTPLNNSVKDVFRSVNYSAIFSYDSGWKVPTKINPSKGYWINADKEDILTVRGFKLENPTISVIKEGWNLIGYPFLENINISNIILENVTGYMYKDSRWYSYNSNRSLNSLDKFTSGYGYWFKVL